jgi:hypothetical protein
MIGADIKKPEHIIIAFQDRERLHWWDYFTKNPYHCFIVIVKNSKIYKIDYCMNGIYFTEMKDSELLNNRYYVVPVKDKKYRVILTCSQFCASMAGITGLCLTPKQLERKVEHGRCIWRSAKSFSRSTSGD